MADRVGQQFGNYKLTRFLGRGGFAEVYLAEHLFLKKKQAAIKILSTQLDDVAVEPFKHEAQLIADLDHPSIVHVLDFGMEQGTPYLVMQYAPNGTLRQRHPGGSRLPLPTIVSYVKQLAEALQYAHESRLIHRDIKPENMLLGERQEVLLSDFGIAIVAQSSRYDRTQDTTGTIAYMAPEQIQAHPRPASDQYSLGVVVYEWLSGDRPFSGSFTEIAAKHVLMPPPPLHERVPGIPAAVEQVVMTALTKDPSGRFNTVQAFAKALEQVSGVRPPGSEPVITLPSSGPVTSPPTPSEGVAPGPASLPPPGTSVREYRGHTQWVFSVAWSPDGERLASAGQDGTVQVRDANTGALLTTYRGHSGWVHTVAWSPDGNRLASGSRDKTVQVWDASTGRAVFTYRKHTKTVFSVAWSPDGTLLASGSEDGTVRVWHAASGMELATCRGHTGAVLSIAWSPDSTLLASGSGDRTVRVWHAATGASRKTFRSHTGYVFSVAWSPDGQQIASGSADRTARAWNLLEGQTAVTYRGHTGDINSLAWSPDSEHIVSSSDDKTVQVWEASTGKRNLRCTGHTDWVRAVAWSPDGTRIASGSDDRSVRVWQATSIPAGVRVVTVTPINQPPPTPGVAASMGCLSLLLFAVDALTFPITLGLQYHSWWVWGGALVVTWTLFGLGARGRGTFMRTLLSLLLAGAGAFLTWKLGLLFPGPAVSFTVAQFTLDTTWSALGLGAAGYLLSLWLHRKYFAFAARARTMQNLLQILQGRGQSSPLL